MQFFLSLFLNHFLIFHSIFTLSFFFRGVKGTCRICGVKVAWSKEKVRSHKSGTCTIKADEKKKWKEMVAKRLAVPCFSEKSGTSAKFPASNSAMKLFDSCSVSQAKLIGKKVANFFFRCGIAFRVIDSSAFREMVKSLRPAYESNHLYHSDKLRTTMLDDKYEELKSILVQRIEKASHYTLSLDGWQANDGRHFVNLIVHTALHPPFFYKAIDTSSFSLNKENLIEILVDTANDLGFSKWIGTVLDNASVNIATENFIEEKYPKIFFNGCLSHDLNLLSKDYAKEAAFERVLEKCDAIFKMVTNHQHVNEAYNGIRSKFGIKHKLEHPNETRFSSHLRMVSSIHENKIAIRELVDTHRSTITKCKASAARKSVFFEIVEDSSFWKDVTTLLTFFEPIGTLLTKSEANDYHIENVYKDLFSLKAALEKIDTKGLISKERVLYIYFSRWAFLHSNTMGFAHILNPLTAGAPMAKGKNPVDGLKFDDYTDTLRQLKVYFDKFYDDEEEQLLAREELESFSQEFAEADQSYLEKTVTNNPRAYWFMEGKRNYPTLSKICQRLFQMHASVAATERIWSIFGFIHSKVRNRLQSSSLEKLVFIYVNASLLDEEDKEDYMMVEDFFDCENK